MDEISRQVSFRCRSTWGRAVIGANHPVVDDPAWSSRLLAPLREAARTQLGSVGAGNHYVDIFHDEADPVWVGAHFGSRGLGHKICTGFLNLAEQGVGRAR